MAEVDAVVARDGDATDAGDVFDLMEAAAAADGGLERLVARHRGSSCPAVVQTLTFLLARAAEQEKTSQDAAALVWQTLAGLRSGDPWARANLCTAIGYLRMNESMGPPGAAPWPELWRFLADGLAGPWMIREAVSIAIPELARNGFLERATSQERGELTAHLDRLMADASGYKRQDLADARGAIADLGVAITPGTSEAS